MVGEEMSNAIIAMGMVITLGNVHQHHEHHREAEDRCVVNGLLEDVEVDGEEEDEGDMQVPKCQSMPRWCHWNQQGLDLNCNRHRFLLQCPVLN